MQTALGSVIGRLRTLSYDYEHQQCDARHIHTELQEIIAELETARCTCGLAMSSAVRAGNRLGASTSRLALDSRIPPKEDAG
jgi:hypothetical protein